MKLEVTIEKIYRATVSVEVDETMADTNDHAVDYVHDFVYDIAMAHDGEFGLDEVNARTIINTDSNEIIYQD